MAKKKVDPEYLKMKQRAELYKKATLPDYEEILIEIDTCNTIDEKKTRIEKYIETYQLYTKLFESNQDEKNVSVDDGVYNDDEIRQASAYRQRMHKIGTALEELLLGIETYESTSDPDSRSVDLPILDHPFNTKDAVLYVDEPKDTFNTYASKLAFKKDGSNRNWFTMEVLDKYLHNKGRKSPYWEHRDLIREHKDTKPAKALAEELGLPIPKKIFWRGANPAKQLKELISSLEGGENPRIDPAREKLDAFLRRRFGHKVSDTKDSGDVIIWTGQLDELLWMIHLLHGQNLINIKDKEGNPKVIKFARDHFVVPDEAGGYRPPKDSSLNVTNHRVKKLLEPEHTHELKEKDRFQELLALINRITDITAESDRPSDYKLPI